MGLRGPKTGSIHRSTETKRRVESAIKLRIAKVARKLVSAQLSCALGVQYLMCRPESGKAYIVKDTDLITQFLDGELPTTGETYYYLTTEKPDALAADRMLDRAFGKAAQPVASTDVDGLMTPIQVVDRLFPTVEALRQQQQADTESETTH
jgi:hypothetical protein